MREILFRGKRVDNGKWVEGNLVRDAKRQRYFIMHLLITIPSGHYIEDEYEVIPETVGQYTGLKDKDGRKIFEGDVVDISKCEDYGMYGPATYDYPLVEVRWSNDVCGFDPFANYDCDCGIFYRSNEVMVIGNIHDNPELSEG